MTRPRRVVLGPCPCSRCGLPLFYDGWEWREVRSGDDHVTCKADPAWRWRAA